jgi:glycerol kinase
MNSQCVIAIDAGTTGVRSRAVFPDKSGQANAGQTDRERVNSYREFTQYFPTPGWVEHDATEIWIAVVETLNEVVAEVGQESVAAIGITNQRETVLAWNRNSGEPYGTAIVWQDRRTAARCEELATDGFLPLVRERTGLVLDPYFSGTKAEWLLANRDIPVDEDLAIGTIDAWLIWNLTGGAEGERSGETVFATDITNACRTMLCDIRKLIWDPELCTLLGIPIMALPKIVPSSGRIGVTSALTDVPAGIPISGVAGDQQAALFGQACTSAGMAKNTYGTGSFLLLNVGEECPPPQEGMLTTVAWTLADGTTHYALEGSIFVTGSAIQWLRDGLNIIEDASETEPLASSVDDTGGVYLVPAHAGLGSPWWDPYARGTIVGITRGTGRAEITRAVVESMAYQTRDVVDAMMAASGTPLRDLRVDGGASVMDLLCQFQADQLGVKVQRPVDQETTALGAAYLAGLAEGVWETIDDVGSQWALESEFEPTSDRTIPDALHSEWLRAVERSRGWVEH